jgi:hypothetical protein
LELVLDMDLLEGVSGLLQVHLKVGQPSADSTIRKLIPALHSPNEE